MKPFGPITCWRSHVLAGTLTASACLFLCATPALCQSRPLVTEDPEVIGAGRILLEGGVSYGDELRIPVYGLQGDTWHVPVVGVSVGLGSIVELQLDAGYQRLHVEARGPGPLARELEFSGDRTSSILDPVLATKIRIASERGRRPAVGFRVATKLPSARNETGLGTDLTDVSVVLLVGKTMRSYRLVGNIGVGIIGDPTQLSVQYDPTLFGLSLARRVARGLEAVGEVEGRWQAYKDAPQPAAENRTAVRAGLRYARGRARLDAAITAGFGDIEPRVGFTSGVAWVFDAFHVP